MKNLFKTVIILIITSALSTSGILANVITTENGTTSLATVPPAVTSPIYLCQNSMASPLKATPSVGGTLNWYLTNAPIEVPSAIAPTPSASTVGSTTYYVTQTIGGVESTPRTSIVVNVVGDNLAFIVNPGCDPGQIVAPATKYDAVLFDWGNSTLIPDNSYNYTYTTTGGLSGFGNTIVSHFQVSGMSPGQSATIVVTAATRPCATKTWECSVSCITNTKPTFNPIAPFCSGSAAPLLPLASNEGITGAWSPALVNNTTSLVYTFTPDKILFPCALTQTMNITVTPKVTPTFSGIPVFVCQGATAPVLPLRSSNPTPITGTWSPFPVDTATLGTTTYTFTPTPGQCVVATPTTVSIRVDPVQIPTFSQVAPICSGAALAPLPATSNNSVTGTWSPSLDNTTTKTYTFTPTAGQCANAATMVITVNPNILPIFTQVNPICSGAFLTPLPTTSNNGITGTWSPALNNTLTSTYTFTPTTGQCATLATMTITVNLKVTPIFTARSAICNGDPITPLPTTSTNGINGSWSPALNNKATTTYTFTPTAGQCANPTTLTILVNSIATPNFAILPALCSGSIAPILATTSPNGITGTWSPSTISNTVGRNYIFTPTSGQCANSQTLNVTITPRTTTNFATIPAFCAGSTAPLLATTSPNGVTGTWNPATIDNTTSRSYVFTPNTTECATVQTLNVVVTPLIVPDFVDLSICSGIIPPALATTSPNGVTGTWFPSTINNTNSGAYVFTPDVPQCANAKKINVIVNPSNTLVSISWTVTNAFSLNQIVTITAASAGDYLYQMDSNPFQTSSVFENVASGLHSITVIDPNGCSAPITENNILVINYPKFFTPNNDGNNDKWNIFDLSDQLNSRIFIFDRYGKLLKNISPLESGWDGTYIGYPMPADDYWFTVTYDEENMSKEFKAHFSLKR
ncbi:T9SS type B sorting domain-containing protein [Flavobacterium cellulosilyticum]|uniref:T9SS type B sorting domain-containing protein n=1 Tax=Flavobacterium cellulosilyticum TaxID=2541731 RepID=A0A4R5CBE5_9FLAO|nr:T9SS type B sorting domain-containing protein [Flavobacterium cellulosilyticum]TDD96179.1 T9SS type B sorting domain-containing protein [Flavobacterium cellulosilyticum]